MKLRENLSRVPVSLREITGDEVGRQVNPHVFRDIFDVQSLQDHPEDYLTLSKILWHRDINTTPQIYGAGLDESHGARRVEQWLDERKAARSQGVLQKVGGQK